MKKLMLHCKIKQEEQDGIIAVDEGTQGIF